MKKLLVIGIIALFIGLVFIPSFNAISISMLDNNPPEAPDITGPVTCKPGEIYTYTFVAVDPDRDDVRYFIDWDDGNTEWTDYYPSGEEIIVSHLWNEKRFHLIGARANDTYGALGPWGYLPVSKVDNNDVNEDCFECQSNGKTHLAEKILTILEKDELLSNVIGLSNPDDDRPICILLKSLVAHYAKLYFKYFELVYTTPYETLKYWIYFLLMMNYAAIGIFIIEIYTSLSCGE